MTTKPKAFDRCLPLFGLAVALLSAGVLQADSLVLRDGSHIETRGPYEVQGRRVVFTDHRGQLSALRLEEVDLEASRKLAEAPPAAPTEPKTQPKPVLTLTNKDVEGSPARRVVLPGHGELAFNLPSGWKFEVRQPPGELPPTLVFVPKAVDVKVMLTPMWSPKADPNFNQREQLFTAAKAIAEKLRPQSTREPVVEPFEGTPGYWFWVADPAPKPGEYEYMAQGMLSAGKLALIFTVLTHQQPPEGLSPYFSFLNGVRQVE